MAMSADLGKTLEKFVTDLVATGRYHSKSEVLREGVRLIQERETRLAALDASIARGVADADAGRVKSTSQVFDRLESLNFVQELREKCESLADAPRGYPLVPRHEHLGIRRRPFGNYLIFYRVGANAIEVVHVLHGARDYQRLLFPET